MRCKNSQEALAQAKANANFFKIPFMVFSDTSGNWRCERAVYTGSRVVDNATLIYPGDKP